MVTVSAVPVSAITSVFVAVAVAVRKTGTISIAAFIVSRLIAVALINLHAGSVMATVVVPVVAHIFSCAVAIAVVAAVAFRIAVSATVTVTRHGLPGEERHNGKRGPKDYFLQHHHSPSFTRKRGISSAESQFRLAKLNRR
jgi:hypothetical protein